MTFIEFHSSTFHILFRCSLLTIMLWTIMGSNLFLAECECTGPGAEKRRRAPWTKQLTEAEAAPFQTIDFIDGAEWLPAWRVWVCSLPVGESIQELWLWIKKKSGKNQAICSCIGVSTLFRLYVSMNMNRFHLHHFRYPRMCLVMRLETVF